jgi:hypothetical protein
LGQVRRGSTTTTHAVRAAKRRSQASLARLSWELGINPKTVAKWRKRATVEDMKTGPSELRSTVLTATEKTMVVAFSRHTRLPPDDGLYALQPSLPHSTRSALQRCLQGHGISRRPDVEDDKPKPQKFKRYPIGPRKRFSNRWRTRWLDPHLQCRSADRRRQALSLLGTRPDIQVCRCSTHCNG